jgi:hypothetical protein
MNAISKKLYFSKIEPKYSRYFKVNVNRRIRIVITFCGNQEQAQAFGEVFHRKEKGKNVRWIAKEGVVIAFSGKDEDREVYLMLTNYK